MTAKLVSSGPVNGPIDNSTEQEILKSNIDSTLATREGTYRKPRSVAGYEWSWLWPVEESFGSSILHSILNAFGSVFEYKNLPEEIDPFVFNVNLIQSGRMKIIKVGKKFYPVHITPMKFGHQGMWLETQIVEPYLPGLSGKKTEKFKGVEFKNNATGGSLVRLIYPFLKLLDDVMFNMDNNQKILSGKFVHLQTKIGKLGDNKEEENALSQWMLNGKPVKSIQLSATDAGNSLPIVQLQVQDATDSFIKTFDKFYGGMLAVMGIPNNNVEGKKERMITGEITIQNIMESAIIEDMLNQRMKAVEEFNKMFGTNVTVSLRQDLGELDMVETETKEVQDEQQ